MFTLNPNTKGMEKDMDINNYSFSKNNQQSNDSIKNNQQSNDSSKNKTIQEDKEKLKISINNSNLSADSFSSFRRENDDTEFEKTLNDIEQEMNFKNYNESKTIERMQREFEIKEEWNAICTKINIDDDQEGVNFRLILTSALINDNPPDDKS